MSPSFPRLSWISTDQLEKLKLIALIVIYLYASFSLFIFSKVFYTSLGKIMHKWTSLQVLRYVSACSSCMLLNFTCYHFSSRKGCFDFSFSSKEKCQRRERRMRQKDGMEERSGERREEVGGKGRKLTPNQTW